jgi:hypothetical protein
MSHSIGEKHMCGTDPADADAPGMLPRPRLNLSNVPGNTLVTVW